MDKYLWQRQGGVQERKHQHPFPRRLKLYLKTGANFINWWGLLVRASETGGGAREGD